MYIMKVRGENTPKRRNYKTYIDIGFYINKFEIGIQIIENHVIIKIGFIQLVLCRGQEEPPTGFIRRKQCHNTTT